MSLSMWNLCLSLTKQSPNIRWKFYKKQKLITLREHMCSSQVCCVCVLALFFLWGMVGGLLFCFCFFVFFFWGGGVLGAVMLFFFALCLFFFCFFFFWWGWRGSGDRDAHLFSFMLVFLFYLRSVSCVQYYLCILLSFLLGFI